MTLKGTLLRFLAIAALLGGLLAVQNEGAKAIMPLTSCTGCVLTDDGDWGCWVSGGGSASWCSATDDGYFCKDMGNCNVN